MKSKNILLLGGAGNIGKQLTLSFLKDYNIFLLDKSMPRNFELKNIKFIKYDLFKSKSILKIPKVIDTVIFLVGKTGGPQSLEIKNLKKYIDINCETLINFLKYAQNLKIKKIIFTSTEHVYGDGAKKTGQTKLTEPSPKNYYGASKLLSEKILYSFYKKNFTNIDILRVPRIISHNVKNPILSMIRSANKTKKITINDTKAKMNFIHSEDMLTAFQACLKKKNTGFRILNIFNNSKPLSLIYIAKYIKKKINKKIKIVVVKRNYKIEHNPINLIVSNKFSKKILKWNPLINNKKIINKLINKYEPKNYSR
jgi:nucleoside-diphosphate-sugar epimerase